MILSKLMSDIRTEWQAWPLVCLILAMLCYQIRNSRSRWPSVRRPQLRLCLAAGAQSCWSASFGPHFSYKPRWLNVFLRKEDRAPVFHPRDDGRFLHPCSAGSDATVVSQQERFTDSRPQGNPTTQDWFGSPRGACVDLSILFVQALIQRLPKTLPSDAQRSYESD